MIDNLQFSTDTGLLPRGGLLICGLNWGGASDRSEVEAISTPWAPYFSHPANGSRYQTCLLKWFRMWGWKLNPAEPTLLDLCISQTNLFSTQSPRFRDTFDAGQWVHALQRLCRGIGAYNISGLLITSGEIGTRLIDASRNPATPEWTEAFGAVSAWSPYTNDSLAFTTATATRCRIAIVNHPASAVADADVQANKTVMHAWIGEVLGEYRRKLLCGEHNTSAGEGADHG